jgi:hypothetical protein
MSWCFPQYSLIDLYLRNIPAFVWNGTILFHMVVAALKRCRASFRSRFTPVPSRYKFHIVYSKPCMIDCPQTQRHQKPPPPHTPPTQTPDRTHRRTHATRASQPSWGAAAARGVDLREGGGGGGLGRMHGARRSACILREGWKGAEAEDVPRMGWRALRPRRRGRRGQSARRTPLTCRAAP